MDLVRDNLNRGYARVVLIALVHTVFQVTEVGGSAICIILRKLILLEKTKDAHRAPVLFDELPVLADLCDASKGRPVCRLLVEEGNINVRVMLQLLEFVGYVVREEDKC